MSNVLELRPTHLQKPTCPTCRLNAARLGEEQRARYQPPLGAMFKVRTKPHRGGRLGYTHICPRCVRIPFIRDGERQVGSLVEQGYVSQRQVRAAKVTIRV